MTEHLITTDEDPAAAMRRHVDQHGDLPLDELDDRIVTVQIELDALLVIRATRTRDRIPRESVADPDLDLPFAIRTLRAAIRGEKRIAVDEARRIANGDVAGKMREAARSILYRANRNAAALGSALRIVETLHRNRPEEP